MSKLYYNGVLLPEIPIVEGYSYAWIRKNNTSGYYDLICTNNSQIYFDNNICYNGTHNRIWYRINIENPATWELYKNNTNYSVAYAISDTSTVLWSNTDIPNGSATATEIYFYASEPIKTENLNFTLDDLMNTTNFMTCLRNNSAQDDGLDTITGVDWFKYNNVVASNLYVSGNMWIGFGANSEQLKPYRRDGKMYYLYRQEDILDDGTKFLKIRWEGWTQHNSSSDTSRLIYEHFIFDDGRMFLNIVQAPSSTSYIGTSQLVCGSKTYSLPLSTSPIQLLFTPSDNTGVEWTITQEVPVFATIKYLLKCDNKIYRTDGTELDENEINSNLFLTHGSNTLPTNDVLKSFTNLSVLAWSDVADMKLKLTATVSGIPPTPQEISFVLDTTDKTIKGIDSIEFECVGTVKISCKNGTEWTEEQTIEEFINDTENVWKLCLNNLKMNCKILLYDDATFTYLKFNYIN